jgi:hypothetical protein
MGRAEGETAPVSPDRELARLTLCIYLNDHTDLATIAIVSPNSAHLTSTTTTMMKGEKKASRVFFKEVGSARGPNDAELVNFPIWQD